MAACEPRETATRNVRGLERVLSIGGGLLLGALGVASRDNRGNRQLGVASLLLLRGLSGHCSVKSALDDPLEEIRYLRARIQRLQELLLMAEEVAERSRPAPVQMPLTDDDIVAATTPRHAKSQ